MIKTITLTDQWSDFLLREHDLYAASKYEILLSWIGNISGKLFLVIGCGSGEFCALLAERGAVVDAMDIDEKNVALALQTALKFNVSFTTFVSSVESITTNRAYDYVVATDVLEHIENDYSAAQKLYSLLKPDGQLVMTVPALQLLMGHHDKILGHFRRYNGSSLRRLLEKNFIIHKMRYFGFFLIPVTILLSKILKRPYPVVQVGQMKKKNLFLGKLINFYFNLEKKINIGLGTSLLVIATRKK